MRKQPNPPPPNNSRPPAPPCPPRIESHTCPCCGSKDRHVIYSDECHAYNITRHIEIITEALDKRENPCPRCGSDSCNDPDSKACSDNCITRHQKTTAELQAQIKELEGNANRQCTADCMHSCLNYAGAMEDANHFEQSMKEATAKLTKLVEFVKSLRGVAFTKDGITLDAYIDAALYGLEKVAPHHKEIL